MLRSSYPEHKTLNPSTTRYPILPVSAEEHIQGSCPYRWLYLKPAELEKQTFYLLPSPFCLIRRPRPGWIVPDSVRGENKNSRPRDKGSPQPALAREIRAPCWQQLSCSQLLLGLCCSQCVRSQKNLLDNRNLWEGREKARHYNSIVRKGKYPASTIQLSKGWASGFGGARKSWVLPFCPGETIWGEGRGCQK